MLIPHPKLQGEGQRLQEETLRDYRRAGLHLSKAKRDAVEALRKEMATATIKYRHNITQAKQAIQFTRADLEGVTDGFLGQAKTGEDQFTVMANVTFHYLTVIRSAKQEAIRKNFRASGGVLKRRRIFRCWKKS